MNVWALIFAGLGCYSEHAAHPIPTELTSVELGVVYPPFGPQYNAFSAQWGPIYRQAAACFVIWNRAGAEGELVRITVPCPDSMWAWRNCEGLLKANSDHQCLCLPVDFSEPKLVECPKPSKS